MYMSDINKMTNSPFDTIRQIEQGREIWSARDLQELLGYTEWRKFEDAIERAMIACKNSGHETEEQFVPSANLLKRGKYATQEQKDYYLSRYACYLVAMNSDPRKAEVSHAQTYFAIKTREAETAEERPTQPQQQQLPLQGNDFVEHMDRFTSSWLVFRKEMKAVNSLLNPQKLQKTSAVSNGTKQIAAPKAKDTSPEHIQQEITRTLQRKGPLTLNTLRTSYMKTTDDVTLRVNLGALIKQGTVRSFDTTHSTKFALIGYGEEEA
jgi:hypothetical protein